MKIIVLIRKVDTALKTSMILDPEKDGMITQMKNPFDSFNQKCARSILYIL